MKHLKLTKNQGGQITEIELGFMGKLIAIKKSNMNPHAQQFISQYRAKGAEVIEKDKYIVIDIFKPLGNDRKIAKLGSITIDFDEDTEDIVEQKLVRFYIDMYSKAGFKVE